MDRNKNIEHEISILKQQDYGILDAQHSFMIDGVLGGFKAAIHKLHYTFLKQILLGIMGGVIISFGYIASAVAMISLPAHWEKFGIILLGVIFPGCIILITFLGGGLFTSHIFSTIPVLKGCASKKLYVKGIFGVLLGNFLGTLIFVALYSGAGGMTSSNGAVLTKLFELTIHKLYLVGEALIEEKKLTVANVLATFGIGIASGMLCNLMVCSTLPLASTTKNAAAVVLLMFFPIMFFAVAGFQHGPANSFFMWILFFEAIFAEKIKISIDYLTPNFIQLALFIGLSTIPTLIGNWLSGAILLPGILYLINKEYASVLFKKIKLEYLESQRKRFKTSADAQIKNLNEKLKIQKIDEALKNNKSLKEKIQNFGNDSKSFTNDEDNDSNNELKSE